MKIKMRKAFSKKAIELDMLGWWLIAIVVLVILIFAIVMLRGKGVGAIEYIKNLFRFKTPALMLNLKNLFLISCSTLLNFKCLFIQASIS